MLESPIYNKWIQQKPRIIHFWLGRRILGVIFSALFIFMFSTFIFQGPLPMTVYVLEDVMLRQYASGGQYGTAFCTTSPQDYKKIIPLIVNEKNLSTVKEDKSFVLLKYIVLQDGTIKIGQQTVVSINC